MPNGNHQAFEESLEAFKNISEKAVIADFLAKLSAHENYSNLLDILGDPALKNILDNSLIHLIIFYLALKKHVSNADLQWEIFNIQKLDRLKRVIEYYPDHIRLIYPLDIINPDKKRQYAEKEFQFFIILLDAIVLYDLSDTIFQDADSAHRLLQFNQFYLQNPEGIELINQLGSIEENDVEIFNMLLNEATEEKKKKNEESLLGIVTKRIQNDIHKWRNVYEHMHKLSIESKTITDYEIILELNINWINHYPAELDKRLCTLDGIKYVLKHINPNQLNESTVATINYLVSKFNLHDPASSCEVIQKFFTHSESDFEKLFTKLQLIIESYSDDKKIGDIIDDPQLLLQLHNSHFETSKSLSKILPLFSIVAPSLIKCEIYSRTFKALTAFGNKYSNTYIQKLNLVIAKLEYKKVICELSDAWLSSEKSLEKLNKFSTKYFTSAGIRIINQFDITIDDEIIKMINECDHLVLMNQLNHAQTASDNLTVNTETLAVRIKKIDEHIKQLKSNDTTTTSLDRKKDNVIAMLEHDCPFSLEKLISREKDDGIIIINEQSKALTYEELNKSLCLILQPNSSFDAVASRETAEQCVGKPYPQLKRELLLSDLAEFNEGNLDLNLLNEKLGLAEEKQKTKANQVDRFTELKNSYLLTQIPGAFFDDASIDFLAQLHPDFFNKNALFKYLQHAEITQFTLNDLEILNQNVVLLEKRLNQLQDLEVFFSGIPKTLLKVQHLAYLLQLDFEYFLPENMKYLHEGLSINISENIITKLNYLIKFNPLNLPAKQLNDIPLAWCENKIIIDGLSKLEPKKVEILIDVGFYEFAKQNIAQACFVFQNNWAETFDNKQLSVLLRHYRSHPDFTSIWKLVEKTVSVEKFTDAISTKEHLSFYTDLYRFLCTSDDKKNSLFFNEIKGWVKQDLLNFLNSSTIMQILSNLEESYQNNLSAFVEELEIYASNHFKIDKNNKYTTNWTFTKREHLDAYNAIIEAIDKNCNFGELRKLFAYHWNIQKGFSFSSGLFPAINKFNQDVVNSFNKFRNFGCTKEYYKAFTAAALLSDNFYRFLTHPESAYHYAAANPHTYFTIMYVYLPADFNELKKHDEIKQLYQSHVKRLRLQKSKIRQKKPKQTKPSEKVNSLKPVIKQITTLPIRLELEDDKPEYQLQDPDIFVGITHLRSFLDAQLLFDGIFAKLPASANNFQINREIPAHHKIIFIPFGNIVENERNKSCNVIDMICETSISNKNYMCLGVFNVNQNHNILILLYTGPESQTQILIIDPAYTTFEKQKTSDKIKTIFNRQLDSQCKFIDIDIIQQFNQYDCGIACLQTIYDIIQHGAITICDDKITICREKIKLDAKRYIGNELEFVKLAKDVRQEWEDKLSQHRSYFINYNDGNGDEYLGSYNFQSNKEKQFLEDELENLASDITADFRKSYESIIQQYFNKNSKIPTIIPDELNCHINSFMVTNAAHLQFTSIARKYPGELNVPNIKSNLEAQIFHIYADIQYARLDEEFFNFLKETSSKKTPENLPDIYEAFAAEKVDPELLIFFSHINHNHFDHIKNKALVAINHQKKSSMPFNLISTPFSSFFANPTPKSTQIENKIFEDQEKNNLVKIMEEILEKIGKIKPSFSNLQNMFFYKLISDHEKLVDLQHNCIAWKNWFSLANNKKEIFEQKLYIAEQLRPFTSSYPNDNNAACNVLRVHLARLLDISEDIINRNNKRTYTVLYDGSLQEIVGYKYLQKAIDNKISQLKESTYAIDHTQNHDFNHEREITSFKYLLYKILH